MRKTGWKGPDYPDPRDHKYGAVRYRGEIPDVITLPNLPVEDQGDVGSCVFKALTYCMEHAQLFGPNQTKWYLSALQAYYRYRELYANIDIDDGAYIRVALAMAKREGVCKESLWPYGDGTAWYARPPQTAFNDAKNHKISQYLNLEGESKAETIDNMLACLASGFVFMGGVSLYDSFLSDEVARTGRVPMPNLRSERFRGGHAMVWCGVDLHKEVWITRNSWGAEWGMNGYCEMPLDYLTDLGSDFWTVRTVTE